MNADKLEAAAAAAFGLAGNSRRGQAAITKARGILRDSVYWHMTTDGALVILSPDSSELYEVTEGKCEQTDGCSSGVRRAEEAEGRREPGGSAA